MFGVTFVLGAYNVELDGEWDANLDDELIHLAYIGNGEMGHEECEGNPQRNRGQRRPTTFQRTTGAAHGRRVCTGSDVGSPVLRSLHTPSSTFDEALGVVRNRPSVSILSLFSALNSRYSDAGQS